MILNEGPKFQNRPLRPDEDISSSSPKCQKKLVLGSVVFSCLSDPLWWKLASGTRCSLKVNWSITWENFWRGFIIKENNKLEDGGAKRGRKPKNEASAESRKTSKIF